MYDLSHMSIVALKHHNSQEAYEHAQERQAAATAKTASGQPFDSPGSSILMGSQ
jgi:hypothetical protein